MTPRTERGALRSAAALVFVEDLDPSEDAIELDPADAHHLVDVLRVGPRELVVASDGAGSWRECVLRPRGTGHGPAISGRRPPRRPRSADRRGDPDVVLEPSGAILAEPAPSPPVTVAFALTKGSRTEWAVQKLTELGVDRIVPIVTARTVVQVEPRSAPARDDRLRRIAREAAAQCRSPRLPLVSPASRLDDVLAAAASEGGRAV
ncbi:MAG: RsmE family RNA methyltransferase, partial [Actinomycetota bacterium]|nr:RsmE family RNA methyltransferase [Actinomycetota bacterium]